MQTVHSLLAHVRKESGCANCSFQNLKGDEYDFGVVEEWKTQEDLDAHMESKVFGILLGAMKIMGKSWKITLRTSSGTRVIEDFKKTRA